MSEIQCKWKNILNTKCHMINSFEITFPLQFLQPSPLWFRSMLTFPLQTFPTHWWQGSKTKTGASNNFHKFAKPNTRRPEKSGKKWTLSEKGEGGGGSNAILLTEPKFLRVLGGQGILQIGHFWQCQDFDGACYCITSILNYSQHISCREMCWDLYYCEIFIIVRFVLLWDLYYCVRPCRL